jgi:hypothetical protein
MDTLRIPVTADIMARLLALQVSPDEPLNAVLARHLPRCNGSADERRFPAREPERLEAASGRLAYRLFGVNYAARNAADATCHVLRTLGQGNPDFFESLAPRVAGRSRNHLAQTREAVYPGRPELAKHTREVAPGWFLGTNIANREKMAILQAACEVAGIRLGTDLVIDLEAP